MLVPNEDIQQLMATETCIGIAGNKGILPERLMALVLRGAVPGENWDDEHHQDTPARFIRSLRELTEPDPDAFKFTTFPSTSNEMVAISDIKFVSLCAHHMLPFVGHCHIAYIPNGRIAGLSKFARAVGYMAKGLWVQEELTNQLADWLEEELEPLGLGVIMAARHMCMEIRGVQSAGAITTTSAMRGVLLDPSRGAREEFLSILRNRSNLL